MSSKSRGGCPPGLCSEYGRDQGGTGTWSRWGRWPFSLTCRCDIAGGGRADRRGLRGDAAHSQPRRRCVRPSVFWAAVDERVGHVFVVGPATANGKGHVSVLNARRGTLLHTVVLGSSPGLLSVDAQTGRVFKCSQDNGTVSVLDAARGVILSTVSLGKPVSSVWPSPVKVVVDARTNRLFVIHHYDSTVSVLDGHTGMLLHIVSLR